MKARMPKILPTYSPNCAHFSVSVESVQLDLGPNVHMYAATNSAAATANIDPNMLHQSLRMTVTITRARFAARPAISILGAPDSPQTVGALEMRF